MTNQTTNQTMKPKLLCVDDESAILDTLNRVLRKDFEVFTASSGAQGFELLELHPDMAVVLSDHRMPGMTGLEFLIETKKRLPDAVRAILSGQIDLEDMIAAINTAQIHRFILKPWENDYLRVQMLEALSEHNVLRERTELQKLSLTDPVTHLANHRHFQDQLRIEIERAIRHERPVSLLMIDIDHFKHFNDQFGHPAGDEMLKAVARRLFDLVRTIDTVARYGGEEFAMILPDTDLQNASVVAERVRVAFEGAPFTSPNGRPAFLTISTGIATSPTHTKDPKELIAIADRALYQAKRQGRNQTVGATIV